MDIVDILQDIAFETGHRIVYTTDDDSSTGTLVVLKKGQGYKAAHFQETKITLISNTAITLDLHEPNSVNMIRGFYLSPIGYQELNPMLFNNNYHLTYNHGSWVASGGGSNGGGSVTTFTTQKHHD